MTHTDYHNRLDEILVNLVSGSLMDNFNRTEAADDSGLIELEAEAKLALTKLTEEVVDEVINVEAGYPLIDKVKALKYKQRRTKTKLLKGEL